MFLAGVFGHFQLNKRLNAFLRLRKVENRGRLRVAAASAGAEPSDLVARLAHELQHLASAAVLSHVGEVLREAVVSHLARHLRLQGWQLRARKQPLADDLAHFGLQRRWYANEQLGSD